MKLEEILELAEKASGGRPADGFGVMLDNEQLQKFVALIVERERERAAMICYACRDIEYGSEEIAKRILNQG